MGAVVIEKILGQEQISALRALAENKMIVVGSKERKKHRLQVPNDYPEADAVASLVLEATESNALFQAATYPQIFSPPRFCCYGPQMGYRDHLDNPHMGKDRVRTDISVTIALTDGGAYDGGDLVTDSDRSDSRWKGNAGDCVVYSGDTVHRVEPVTRGERLVCIFWIQSLVRDASKRQILFDLAQGFLDPSPAPDTRRRNIMRQSHGRLLRMWAGQ